MSAKRLDRKAILQPGFSTPWDAPLVPSFPFSFRDVRVLTAAWRTDPDAIAAQLPPPLEPLGDVVLAHIYDMGDVDWLGHYQESNVMIGARMPGGKVRGGYSCYLFLAADGGVAHGREIHGQPKKSGAPRLEFRQDLIVGTIARNGIEVLTATMPYKQKRATLAALKKLLPFDTNLALKAVDHIDHTPAIRQLTARKLTQVKVRECWRGPGTVELRPNAQAPLHRLPVLEMLDNFYWRADFTLVKGRVIYNYLKEE